MVKYFLSFIFIVSSLLVSFEVLAAKRGKAKPSFWSVSITNGYTFWSSKQRSSAKEVTGWDYIDGQMNKFFSSIEIARNFNRYEIGGKVQLIGPTFVSPFFKWNIVKQSKRSIIKPSLVVGVVPSRIFGSYVRLNLGIRWNRYVTLNPFVGFYGWYKIPKTDLGDGYEKNNVHINTGFNLNIYF